MIKKENDSKLKKAQKISWTLFGWLGYCLLIGMITFNFFFTSLIFINLYDTDFVIAIFKPMINLSIFFVFCAISLVLIFVITSLALLIKKYQRKNEMERKGYIKKLNISRPTRKKYDRKR